MKLQDKVALVTGGSRGIGKACAVQIAAEGATTIISYASNSAAADATVAEITAQGGKAEALQFDVGDPESVKAAFKQITKAHGGLHILIANAGISVDGLIMRYSEADLEKIYRTNVFGSFYCAKAAVRPMMKSKWGRIIFMGSVVGESGNAGQVAYSGTKAALDGMAKSLAKELASRNITVNVIAPGYIETDMTNALSEEQQEQIRNTIPLGRVGSPEDIANASVFLASDDAKYITGQVLNVNGGMYM
ncbi:MAG: 3-oxoacyl-ACP reductase family protein [Myxococcota bacterium]|nr:3-oxoacyl-ACP reductase family protein [Myxococcota bacterium]